MRRGDEPDELLTTSERSTLLDRAERHAMQAIVRADIEADLSAVKRRVQIEGEARPSQL